MSVSEQAAWGPALHGPMPRLEAMVAVVGVMSMVASWTCQWPTKRALAVAVLVVDGAAVVDELAVVEDVPPPDVVFEHPAVPTVITVAVMAATHPSFTIEVFAVIRLSLQNR
ncbi:MAG TPA: hypothetical protein VNW96_00320 [Mycobacterium sp.]|nr:hypothetical protein [Mycobacterium sp.]